jgi:diguanylate cyclase (GGDEF)-like protein
VLRVRIGVGWWAGLWVLIGGAAWGAEGAEAAAQVPAWRLGAEVAHGAVTLSLLGALLRSRARERDQGVDPSPHAAAAPQATGHDGDTVADPADVRDPVLAPDPLTGLSSRSGWVAQAERALGLADPRGTTVTLVLIDLDRLGGLNDTHGHRAGDRALQALAAQLRAALGPDDLAGRHGGGQFAVLRPGAPAQVQAWAQSLTCAVAQAPVALDGGRSCRVTVSVGLAAAQGADGLDLALHRAARALKAAQAAGGDAVRCHDPASVDRAGLRLQTARELALAVEADQLRLDYQAVYDAGGRTPVAAEALLRWQHPQRGLVPPAQFIDIAEETGLIVPIGAWVLRRACADALCWPQPLPVAVNLSVRQLHSRDLVEQVRVALATSGLPASRLELELTESALAETPQVADKLDALRALGVALSLDDFGTGFSSLAYLQRYRFDRLKIDRAFVQPLQDADDTSLALVRALVDLARALGMRCTAEGVEHAQQLDLLRALGCDAMQGFHLARPCGAAELQGRLTLAAG